MAYHFIGKSLARTEDARLVRGQGQYTADIALPGTCRLFVVRSPYASANFGPIGTSAASASPGVLLVLTADDPRISSLGGFTSRIRRKTPSGEPNFEPPYLAISRGCAKFVGDVIAAIFAETIEQAKDASELLEIDWDVRPAIAETRDATQPGAAQVWDEVPNNICFVHDEGDRDAVSAALVTSPHKVTLTYPVTRVIAAPMESNAGYGWLFLRGLVQFERSVRTSVLTIIWLVGDRRLRGWFVKSKQSEKRIDLKRIQSSTF